MSGTAGLKLSATVLCILWALPLALAAGEARTIPVVRPELQVRLINHLTSYSSPVGTPFRCVVIRAFHAHGVVIPRGSYVFGTVRKEQAVGLGVRHERASLELSFDQYETPNGERFPLAATLTSIDNAREEINATGRIKGVLAANNPGNLLNGLWARPSSNLAFRSLIGLTGAANQVWAKYSMGPIGAAGFFVARSLIVAFPEPEIHLPPGTDMTLAVQIPEGERSDDETTPAETDAAPTLLISDNGDRLSDWIRARLQPIFFKNGAPAEDLLNVLVLGSREQVVAAFATSGWTLADHRSLRASSRVYGAFSSMRTYSAAPVSILLYRGLEPDLVFEKSLDTVTQRHHVRFWRAGKFNGDEVWLGAATHDTGVTFRLRSMAFTHKIDRNIDLEREKVVTDLDFSGCSEKPVLLNSSLRPASFGAGRISTDGRLIMLAAQPCSTELTMEDAPAAPGNRLTRVMRRVVLETRNYLLRDNAYYWGYRMIRSSHNHSNPLLH